MYYLQWYLCALEKGSTRLNKIIHNDNMVTRWIPYNIWSKCAPRIGCNAIFNAKEATLPSLMETTLFSPSLFLMQVMVGHWDRSQWNLFHAPSSGKATAMFPVSKLFSSRIKRGMADNNLKRGGGGRDGKSSKFISPLQHMYIPRNDHIWQVKSLLKGMNVKNEYLSRSSSSQWDVGEHGGHGLGCDNLLASLVNDNSFTVH